MGGLSTISLDPQVMTALTPSCRSNEVGPVCTCQTTNTTHKHTVHMHPHLDKVKARGSDFYILQWWWWGNSCTLLASQCEKLKVMQLLNSRKRL